MHMCTSSFRSLRTVLSLLAKINCCTFAPHAYSLQEQGFSMPGLDAKQGTQQLVKTNCCMYAPGTRSLLEQASSMPDLDASLSRELPKFVHMTTLSAAQARRWDLVEQLQQMGAKVGAFSSACPGEHVAEKLVKEKGILDQSQQLRTFNPASPNSRKSCEDAGAEACLHPAFSLPLVELLPVVWMLTFLPTLNAPACAVVGAGHVPQRSPSDHGCSCSEASEGGSTIGRLEASHTPRRTWTCVSLRTGELTPSAQMFQGHLRVQFRIACI
eukprot:scaffold13675_cov18-Tisochrysis_lutea.AAC.3